MITVKIKGGAGNQMFQYACGKALARAQKTDLELDLTQLLDPMPRRVVRRNYELECFNLKPRLTRLSRVARKFPLPVVYTALSCGLALIEDGLGRKIRVVERKIGFHPEVFLLSGNIYLDGWWQSEKYFKSIENEIRRDFAFGELAPGRLKAVLDEMQKTNSVSLHVRRGDYVADPLTNRVHGFLGREYYSKAVKLIADKTARPRLFVFSDDIAWCRQNLRFPFPAEFIGPECGGNWKDHMHLMSRARHFIIANSSFSWWAAWLAPHRGKIVVAPEKWFNDPSLNSQDIIPESWIRL